MIKQQHKPTQGAAQAAKLYQGGQFVAAEAAAKKALGIKPSDADALAILGLIDAQAGRFDSALKHLSRVIELSPKSADAHFNIACVLQRARNHGLAEKHYLEALRLNPGRAAFHNNLGALYQEQKNFELAQKCFERALSLDPAHENSVSNLYSVYRILGATRELEKLTQTATQRWPTHALHYIARAEALFFLGRFQEGWELYPWRFKSVDKPAIARTQPGLAEWSGENLIDKSVLLWTEQGPGDELMFATALPDIKRNIKQLIVLCSKRMQPIFQRTYPDIIFYGDCVPADVLKTVDLQAPLAALAANFRPNVESFPKQTQKIAADQNKVSALRERYRNGSKDTLVGIAWRSTGVEYASAKTVNLGAWGALFSVPGVRFVNLQYGDCARELSAVRSDFGIDIIQDQSIDSLSDLDSYAAQIAAMDFVVSSSNTAAHFAGALGVNSFVMVPATPGYGLRWYWGERDGCSLWYPSLKVIRQAKSENWMDVIRAVTLEVARQVHARGVSVAIPNFLNLLASSYWANGLREDAAEVMMMLSSFQGHEVGAFFELGRYAKEDSQLDRAISFFDKALEHEPRSHAALNMKGVVLAAQGQLSAAESCYRLALEAAPDSFEVYNNLGTAIRRLGRGIEANTLYERANELKPFHPNILLNLATNLNEIGQSRDAIRHFDQLIQLQPDYAEAHHSRGFALLGSGEFVEGWRELKWRHLVKSNNERPPEDRPPVWAGQDISGKSVLVWTEQGLGDEILAASILPDVVAAAMEVTLICSTRLVPLFKRSFPGARIFDRSYLSKLSLERFDYQFSISELGQAFRPSVESFPQRVSFLSAPADLIAQLRQKYWKLGARPVVGLSWVSANPETGNLKSLDLAAMARAASAPQTESGRPCLVSLQYGDHGPEIAEVERKTGAKITFDPDIDPITNIDSFAAQVAAMDVVVTISNTTAHLAGALGIPTALLLPYNRGRHWYWFKEYDFCPWYPSIRYARQSADLSWEEALKISQDYIREVARHLRNTLRSGS